MIHKSRVWLFCFSITSLGDNQDYLRASEQGDAHISWWSTTVSAGSTLHPHAWLALNVHHTNRQRHSEDFRKPLNIADWATRQHLDRRQLETPWKCLSVCGSWLGSVPRGWLASHLAGKAPACRLPVPPRRAQAITECCWEELSRENDSSVRGKIPNKRGWNQVISFFLCNPQRTAKPSHCRTTGRQKPFSAVTGYAVLANNGSYLLVPFRDWHTSAALLAGRGKTSLSTSQTYRYKMLVAVLLALSVWSAWFISVETEASLSSRRVKVKIRGSLCPGELNSAMKMTFCPYPSPSFLDAGTWIEGSQSTVLHTSHISFPRN